MPKIMIRRSLCSLVLACFITAMTHAGGIYRDGVGARAMALGGADAAWAEDALGAFAANPAALAWLNSSTLDIGFFGSKVDGKFTNRANNNGNLDDIGGLPEAAFAYPIRNPRLTLGIAVIPEAVKAADWFYNDTPGGLGGATSYGPQRHRSELLLLRSSIGAAIKLGEQWSLGASVGLLYNANRLQAPYIFQTQPALAGAKTLLDLQTDGFGVDGHIGLFWRPTDKVQIGVTYKTESDVHSHGDANGDVGVQLGMPSVPFHYDAEVVNHFPQRVTAALSWQAQEQWRLALQVDWCNWSGAFRQLPVRLRNGNNATINTFAGTMALDDSIPLQWRDEFDYRAGLEYSATDRLKLRAGYRYGRSAVPNQTLLPVTALINEHVFTAGAGYNFGRWQLDFAYQWELPASRSVGTSSLLSGEYSNSRTEVSIHTLALTTSFRF